MLSPVESIPLLVDVMLLELIISEIFVVDIILDLEVNYIHIAVNNEMCAQK